MAEILRFRALHYKPRRVSALESVVTQPYDKITAEMQARYYERSPYNLVRIIRGRQRPQDTDQDNVYTRAASDFHDWIRKDILVSQPEPALYPYTQLYNAPGQPGVKKQRRAFIALCRIEDYSAGAVYRHEETLSGPKADRLELLKATRAHFGQIFMLYSDPEGAIEAALVESTRGEPWERVSDEYETEHSVWRISDPSIAESIAAAMRDKKLVIADGHHRYEAALAYRNYCRGRSRQEGRTEYVMMTFTRLETEGLTILPTHRLVHSLPGFAWERFAADARRHFDWEAVDVGAVREPPLHKLQEHLTEAGCEHPVLGVYAGPGKVALLHLRNEAELATQLPDLPASLRRIDVVLLHRLVLEHTLGIDRPGVQEEKYLRYAREFEVALQEVDTGKAQVCFLMNPTPVQAVWDNALAGHVLPQKSTDFYPKLLSGLTIYWLDNPAGI